jgi:hypothetical protein
MEEEKPDGYASMRMTGNRSRMPLLAGGRRGQVWR